MEFGIVGLIILALDIWALINVWGGTTSTGSKLLWSILILVLPLIGLLVWFIAGPKGSPTTI